jgi:hypothetical protein
VRISMGILKNRHGVYEVRKKVPKRLGEAEFGCWTMGNRATT